MAPEGRKPTDFKPVETPEEGEQLLRESVKTLAPVMLWTRNQEHVIHTHLTLVSDVDKVLYVWVPKDVDPRQFMDELARNGISECFFSISLSRAVVFFKAAFKDFDPGGFRFRIPKQLFKVQRRKDMRFPIPDGFVLKVEYRDPLLPDSFVTRKVIDLSAGGMAIAVPAHEAPVYVVGLVLKQFTFTLRGKKLVVDAEVRYAREQPEDSRLPGLKVGVQFQDLRASDSQYIASYVFEESRKFLSRFL
jgi:hypothetical protein